MDSRSTLLDASVSMLRTIPIFARVPFVTCLMALVVGAFPAAAQTGPTPLSRTQFGIGYVANAPDAVAGGTAYVLLPRAGGIGFYVDAKFDVSSPSKELGYNPDVTATQVENESSGAEFIKFEESWKSFNVGLMRPLTPSLVAYAGGGIAKATRFDLYQVSLNDPLGLGGIVWAKNPDEGETRLNVMVGVLMRITRRVSTHFGYETQPSGMTVGITLRIPPW
jgi:hypothetical protein